MSTNSEFCLLSPSLVNSTKYVMFHSTDISPFEVILPQYAVTRVFSTFILKVYLKTFLSILKPLLCKKEDVHLSEINCFGVCQENYSLFLRVSEKMFVFAIVITLVKIFIFQGKAQTSLFPHH